MHYAVALVSAVEPLYISILNVESVFDTFSVDPSFANKHSFARKHGN
jgi:hypothetical protein